MWVITEFLSWQVVKTQDREFQLTQVCALLAFQWSSWIRNEIFWVLFCFKHCTNKTWLVAEFFEFTFWPPMATKLSEPGFQLLVQWVQEARGEAFATAEFAAPAFSVSWARALQPPLGLAVAHFWGLQSYFQPRGPWKQVWSGLEGHAWNVFAQSSEEASCVLC